MSSHLSSILLKNVYIDILIRKNIFIKSSINQSSIGANFIQKKKLTLIRSLDNISLSISSGDRIGIIGLNGSGKTTLLRVLAGIYPPTHGEIDRKGKATTLINTLAAFQNDLTGIDNIFLRGYFLGLSKDQIEKNIDQIISFSELGNFIYMPLKNYSQGMKSRLSIAILLIINPDILLIDENIATGDIKFLGLSNSKLQNYYKKAQIAVFASHSLSFLKTQCDKLIWLNKGKLMMFDDINSVSKEYLSFIK